MAQIVLFCCFQMEIMRKLVPGYPSYLGDFLQLLEMTGIEFELVGPGDQSSGSFTAF